VSRAVVLVEGIPAPGWRTRVPGFCAAALREAGFTGGEIGVLLCGDNRIADLNRRLRGKKGPTDVLSFPTAHAGDESTVNGDIVISVDALRRNASRFGVSDDAELKRLLMHGLLHLAGMDHGGGRGEGMLELQELLLRRLEARRVVGAGARGGKR
jgi:probable rRNA maturation factor